jgi:8-oxo-dGTP diphosphatase
MLNNTTPQFGTLEEGTESTPRPGAYAIILDEQDRVAVVEVRGKYFLPGGAIEVHEEPAQSLMRELQEETGWLCKIHEKVCTANEYVYFRKERYYVNKLGSFYRATILRQTEKKIEQDHTPRWVSIEAFAKQAAHQSQVWAVNQVQR